MTKRGILILAAVFGILSIATLAAGAYSNAGTDILEQLPIHTNRQNSCLGYDVNSGISLVGTYNNELIAFGEDNQPLWSFQAKGPFKQLIVHSESRTVYAGNEDTHVYMIDLDTGAIKGDIPVQRRIFNIDVMPDGSEILVSAGVGSNKHNILRYSSAGEQLSNFSYTTRSQGAAYTAAYDGILMINNRAEIRKLDLEGNILAETRLKYELVDLTRIGDGEYFAVLAKDGSYSILDENLQEHRSAKPVESFEITGRSIGADTAGDYLIVGTTEGFLYLFDQDDRQIFTARLPNSITAFLPIDEDIRVTGLGDFVYSISIHDLALAAFWNQFAPLLSVLTVLFPLLGVCCLLVGIGRTRNILKRIGKALWKHRTAYLLLIPTFTLLILFNYSSVFIAITRAFTNWSKDNTTWATMKFIGLDNFRLMLSEGYFLTGLGNLGLLMLTGFVKVLTVPLLVAWLVYNMGRDRQKTVFRFLFVLPMVVPGVVNALMWKQIYDPSIGLINQLLGRVGMENLQRVWLGDEKIAIWAIIFMGFPFVNALAFLVYYGGLMDIDQSIMESATIDGANRRCIFQKIQFPIIAPQLRVILILTFIGTVQDFTSIYLLTAGGPGTSTYVPGLELYFNATKFGRFGYACALGLVMFAFTMIGTIINMRTKSDNGS